MFWADKLLENRTGSEWINDAWTPSGIIHMGGLKGPVIHDVLYRVVKEQGREGKYTFGFDDMDPIDGLPSDLRESHEQYMGVPICNVPAPYGETGTFGEYFSNKMRALFKELNIEAEIYLASEYYRQGKYNDAIRLVLDHAADVRKVYEEMYKKTLSTDWFPLQVTCPQCGKLGTTRVISWNGQTVEFVCEENLVKWAQGCGFKGDISPFDGNAKMPFKVEWAAKWWTFKVTIEGAGKDHASAGGTYDVARKICSDVFQNELPLRLPYEFFLAGGKKMSSSKGLGLTGEELLEVMPPQIARFLMIKAEPNHAVEFSPRGTDIIPRLYDEYQKAAEAYFGKTGEDIARAFDLAQTYEVKKPPSVRFSVLSQWVQMPNMDEMIKKEGLEEWAKYARVWIEKFAPESEKFLVQQDLPSIVSSLSESQKNYLYRLGEFLDKEWSAEDFQVEIYNLAKEMGISSKDAFAAVYIALLGKNHGPKAAWLILSLDRSFVRNRFREAANVSEKVQADTQTDLTVTALSNPKVFIIHEKVLQRFPSISVGVAIIKGVNIEKTNQELEQEKQEFLSSLQGLTTEQLGQYTEIQDYRRLYKEMGIDWHSRRPSPEALLRRVALNKGLYTINTCVDAYNLIVMKHRVSIGAFDLDTISFPTILRFPEPSEKILLLGDTEPTMYEPLELAYFDQNGGFNIDFNYRDAQRTAVQIETKNIYINVDGIYGITPQMVERSLKEACNKIMQYCGGTLEIFGVETLS